MLKRTIDFHNLLILLLSNKPSNTSNQGFDVVNHNFFYKKTNNKIMKCAFIRWNSKIKNYKIKKQNKDEKKNQNFNWLEGITTRSFFATWKKTTYLQAPLQCLHFQTNLQWTFLYHNFKIFSICWTHCSPSIMHVCWIFILLCWHYLTFSSISIQEFNIQNSKKYQ
jgi:hypothetical protein